eukprot:4222666-Pyramimonas_sp.AAC.1
MQSMRCNACGPNDWYARVGRCHALANILPTRNLICKTHAAAIAKSAWRWPVHPRAHCQRVGATDAAAATLAAE